MLRSLPYLGLGIKNTTELELLNCRLAGIPADTVHVVDLLERIHPTRARTPTHSLLIWTYLTLNSPQIASGNTRGHTSGASFWKLFLYLLKSGRFNAFQRMGGLVCSLSWGQLVATQNFIAVNTQHIPAWPLDAALWCSSSSHRCEWAWHGALFGCFW